MDQWISYQLDYSDGERGYSPTVQIEVAGCTHDIGMITVGNVYFGKISGAQEQIAAAIAACSAFVMTARTPAEMETLTNGRLPWGPVKDKREILLAKHERKLDSWRLTTFTEREIILDYIKVLRDIPQNFATPEEVIWPEEPPA